MLGERRDGLDCGRARADDRDALVVELVEVAVRVAAGVVVVPAANKSAEIRGSFNNHQINGLRTERCGIPCP